MVRLPSVIILIFLLLHHPSICSAQSIYTDFERDKRLNLEIVKPAISSNLYNSAVNSSFLNSSIFFTTHIPFWEKYLFIAELPFAYANVDLADFRSANIKGTTIGNLYLGFQSYLEDTPALMTEFGIRLPLAAKENNGTVIGEISDLIERAEAFTPGILSVHGMLNYFRKNSSGYSLRARLGPIFWFNTNENSSLGPDVFFVYGVAFGMDQEIVRVKGGVNGRLSTIQNSLNSGKRFFHQFGIHIDFGAAKVKPGFSLRVPLNRNYENIIDYSFGFNLSYLM